MKYYNVQINNRGIVENNSNLTSDTFKNFENDNYKLIGEFRLFENKIEPLEFIKYFLQNKNYLENLDGEYAFVLYDKITKIVYLARDPMGIKNLYYSLENNDLKISSNVFNLISIKNTKKFSIKGVSQYLLYEFLYDPYTLFEDVWSVVRGELITIDISRMKIVSKILFRKKLSEIGEADSHDEDYFATTLRNKITNAHQKRVENHNTILLSGGIDSTVMAIALQKDLGVKDLSAITFNTKKAEFSEVEYAKSVAKKMGIKHDIIQIDPFNSDIDLFDVIDRSNFPYVGSIFLDSLMKSESIRENSNFFAGQDTRLHTPTLNQFDAIYFKYFNFEPLNNIISMLGGLADFSISTNKGNLTKVLKRAQLFNKKGEYILTNLFHMHKNSPLLHSKAAKNTIAELTTMFENTSTNLRILYNKVIEEAWNWQHTDDIAYMTNNFSENGYTTSMPFFDKELVEFSATIPIDFVLKKTKGRAGYGEKSKLVNKYILRKAYNNELPHELIYRDKAVAVTNHIYLNTVMSKYIKDFFVNSKLKSTEAYEELKLYQLINIGLENNGKWKIEDYATVVEVQNLLFLEIIARKYNIND